MSLYPGKGWYHTALRVDDERLWTTYIRNRHTMTVNALTGSILTRYPSWVPIARRDAHQRRSDG